MRQLRCASALAAAVFVASSIAARPALAFAIYTVGAGCPYATIQEALTAAYLNPGEDYVWIVNNQSYTGQHITVGNQDVDIEGGFTDCNDYTIGPGETTTVSGAGNDGGPVFEITGASHVYLGNLVIRDALRNVGGRGGGVSFYGQGSLTLGNTTVTSNQAGYGGGLYVEPNGGDVSLTLLDNTLIIFNTAVADGGGIALIGTQPGAPGYNTNLYVDAPQTLIGYNDAGRGGGLFVQWFARAYLGSPGYSGLGVIYANNAARGGGLALYSPTAFAAGNVGPIASLYTTDAQHPARIQSNNASEFGGGVYLEEATGNQYVPDNSCFVAKDFRIDDNIAPEGAAIHVQANGGESYVALNVPSAVCSSKLSHFPTTTACAAGVTCNSIDGNAALDGLGATTTGAAILFQTDGDLLLDRVSLRNNTVFHAIHVANYGTLEASARFTNVLFADNALGSDLLNLEGSAQPLDVELYSATVTHNTGTSAYVVYTENSFALYDSIIDQPGQLTVAYAGPNYGLYAGGNVSNDTSTLPYGSMQGAPTYVDAAHGNYRLTPHSLGVDFASNSTSLGYDLDGNPRVKDLTSIPNSPGNTLDAGAYEVQFVCAPDEIYCSGFEP